MMPPPAQKRANKALLRATLVDAQISNRGMDSALPQPKVGDVTAPVTPALMSSLFCTDETVGVFQSFFGKQRFPTEAGAQ